MFCFSFPPRNVTTRPERIVVLSAFSLFFISYHNFQQQAQNVLILTRDTLASNQERLMDDDGVGELRAIYNRPQQRSSPRRFISKIGGKINRKKWCLKGLIYTRTTVYVQRLNVFCWFSCVFQ